MNLSKVLFLALLCAIGGLYIWRYESGPLSGRENAVTEGDEEAVFAGLVPSSIDQISINRQGESFGVEKNKTADTTKRETLWTMLQPPGAETDFNHVRDLLGTLSGLKSKHAISKSEQGGGLELFGLVAPELLVSFVAGGVEHSVHFGKKHSFSGRRYAQIGGDERVLLVAESAFASLNKARDDLRNRQPLRFTGSDARLVQISRADKSSLQFERRGDEWFSTGGAREFLVDGDVILRTLNNLSKLEVKRFVDSPPGDLSEFGLANPLLSVQVSFEQSDSPPMTFSIGEVRHAGGGEQGMYISKGSEDRLYEFDKRFFSDLLQPADYFREKVVLRQLNESAITQIKISQRGKDLILKRDASEGWSLIPTGGVESKADLNKVSQYIELLRNIAVLSFPGVGSDTIGDDLIVVTIVSEEAGEKIEYRLGAGKEVSSMLDSVSPETAGGANSNDAPHYGFISFGSEAVSVVLSSKDVTSLGVPEVYFKSSVTPIL